MGKILVVAEKPSVGRDIASVLHVNSRNDGYMENDEYVVTWAIGHLVALCDPEDVDPKYKRWSMDTLPMLPDAIPLHVLPNTKDQFGVVKKLMHRRDIDSIICATDSGREGELIFRYIYSQADCKKPFQRLWISSMTNEAILEGFASLRPGADYDKLYMSAKCRSEADWLVGMNASRAFSLRYDVLLSVGRVQTPTLALIVKRDAEIATFVPDKYFEVKAHFGGGPAPGEYDGTWWDAENKTTRIKSDEDAKEIRCAALNQPGTVERADKSEASIPPPQLYDLTTLQRDANRLLGYSAKRSLDILQALYEKHKLVTYPRTDSRCLPHDMVPQVKNVLSRMQEPYARLAEPLQADLKITKRVFDDSQISDHHAVIPTLRNPNSCALSNEERSIYDLVARRLIAAFYPAYRYSKQEIITRCGGHAFISRGTAPIDWGWKVVYRGIEKEDETITLPDVNVGEVRTAAPVQVLDKQTKPPKRYTDATLLQAMEHAGRDVEDESVKLAMKDSGLGTPATRAATIERLLAVGYARREGKSVVSTPKAARLMRVLPNEISSAETTGRWERALNRIAKGEGTVTPEAFIESIRRFCAYLVNAAQTASGDVQFEKEERKSSGKSSAYRPLKGAKCPVCGGAIIENERAFGCENWKTTGCKFTLWKNALSRQGIPAIKAADAKKLLSGATIELDGHGVRLDGARPVIVNKPDNAGSQGTQGAQN